MTDPWFGDEFGINWAQREMQRVSDLFNLGYRAEGWFPRSLHGGRRVAMPQLN